MIGKDFITLKFLLSFSWFLVGSLLGEYQQERWAHLEEQMREQMLFDMEHSDPAPLTQKQKQWFESLSNRKQYVYIDAKKVTRHNASYIYI